MNYFLSFKMKLNTYIKKYHYKIVLTKLYKCIKRDLQYGYRIENYINRIIKFYINILEYYPQCCNRIIDEISVNIDQRLFSIDFYITAHLSINYRYYYNEYYLYCYNINLYKYGGEKDIKKLFKFIDDIITIY